jgi:hypothetical protein
VRRKLHRSVVWRGWSGGGFGRRRRSYFGRRNRSGDGGIGGRVLSPGRVALGGPTRCSGRRDRAHTGFAALPSTASGSGECNPPRRHPLDLSHCPRSSTRSRPASDTTTFRCCGCFNPRQPDIGWQRRWRRRLQEIGSRPQRKQHHCGSKEHQPSSRPTDPHAHPQLSPKPWNVSPASCQLEGMGTPPNVLHFSAIQSRPARASPPKS